ncbi:putative glutathione S-transferase GSTF1 [Platanthera zijinensis]|uniref:glutathione transferase n=1 Tax=Platanthera zijinensis TaxID=2320716 RepID=A0AAP0GCH8_9ASPA
MSIKLYGSPFSISTARVLAAISEIGLEVELVHVDLYSGHHKHDSHVEKNPFGQVPVLEDGEFVLFESRVITRYLVRKYGKKSGLLKDDDPRDAASVDQWMEVETHHFNKPVATLVYEHLFRPHFEGKDPEEKVVAEEVEKLEKVLDVYEARLSKTKFLAGDFYSLADVHHVPYGHYLVTRTPHGSLIDSRPHVKAWWDAVYSRPASKTATETLVMTP